jgi:hypothetical protein
MATAVTLPASSPRSPTIPCCQKVKNTLCSKVVMVKQCLKGCCSADAKTYALIVLGRFLQAAALAGVVTSLTCLFLFGPVSLLGSLPSAAAFALGHLMVKKNVLPQNSPLFLNPALNWLLPSPPFQVGQPLGLVNSTANCWINASLQCTINDHAVREKACRIPELAQFIHGYEQTRITARSHYQLDGQNLNTFLVSAMRLVERGEISEDNMHADATSFFEWLFGQHPLYDVMRITTRPGDSMNFTNASQELNLIRLQLRPNAANNAQTLFNQFFDHYSEDGSMIRRQLRFRTVPNTLVVSLVRSYGYMTNPADPASLTRVHITDPVQEVNLLTLPEGSSFSDSPLRYQCNGYIVHLGATMDRGHYVAFVKREGKWWCCNDDIVTEVSEQTAMEQMKNSYFLFLNRI